MTTIELSDGHNYTAVIPQTIAVTGDSHGKGMVEILFTDSQGDKIKVMVYPDLIPGLLSKLSKHV